MKKCMLLCQLMVLFTSFIFQMQENILNPTKLGMDIKVSSNDSFIFSSLVALDKFLTERIPQTVLCLQLWWSHSYDNYLCLYRKQAKSG